MTVLLALHRVGPYHHTRFQAAAAVMPLEVLETRPASQEYPWQFEAAPAYPLHRLSGHTGPESDPPPAALDRQLQELLEQRRPSAIVSVGWADRAYQRLLLQAHRRRIPLLIVSDSRLRDQPRSPLTEGLKRQLLRGYAAAMVAGSESRAYLHRLGFPAGGIFEPWDVVDNRFFEQAAAEAGPRQPRFLCVSRLVPKKNHQGLLQAFATYQRQGGGWGLQLVGSGPLLPAIEAQVAALPAPGRVQLLPFCQLPELGRLYGQASAFVLASTSDQWGLVVNEAIAAGLPALVSEACGCAADLIGHDVSGWCFDPQQPHALAALMHAAEHQSAPARARMQAAAAARLQSYTPARFAAGLQRAVQHARLHPRFSRRAALAARLLSHRP
jgi:glycosyltransferase involved in cell wall biosynthesis